MTSEKPQASTFGLTEESAGLQLLLVALAATVLFHGGLLPFTHANTYDAFIHMFFGDSYHRSWFDHWEPRWYTGFATTSYPPGTHMAIGALMYVLPLRAAFVVVQLFGLLLLVIGVFRFSLLWIPQRAAGFAAIALVLSSSVTETVHLFGQLPTIFSLGVFLNGMPYVYRWIVFGGFGNLLSSVVFAAATTAAHHVTTIFGGVLFILPLGLHALRAVSEIRPANSGAERYLRFSIPLCRGLVLAVVMIGAIIVTVFPYWVWSIKDPITQVPIPHGSRESFIERPDLGFVFFLLPWGVAILFLPYVVWKTLTTRLWPLGLSVLLCFVLGTGGTTPISRAILRGAFDILTLDRFTFWATILILPFMGYLIDGLLFGRSGREIRIAMGAGLHRLIIGVLFVSMTLIAVFAAILPTIQPTQPKFIDPAPIIQFLGEDNHDRWRYLTLGFGDQFAYLSAQTEALSVDGNYHSARRLPNLTRFSVERLENAKYLGVPGLGSLRQFLVNADRYHLKYVFSNDAFYDPLLHFTGWSRLNRLENGVAVWEKPDIAPLPRILPRRFLSGGHTLMWGVMPVLALLSAGVIFSFSAAQRNFGHDRREARPLLKRKDAYSRPQFVRRVVLILLITGVTTVASTGVYVWQKLTKPIAPNHVVEAFFSDLDFRNFEGAYLRLDPKTRPVFDDVMFGWRWNGGLLGSYGKLLDIRLKEIAKSASIVDWEVQLNWLTALDLRTETRKVRTISRDGRWFVAPLELRQVQTPVRIQQVADVGWNIVGRRQPRPETDLHRDRPDRPKVQLSDARLVEMDGRFSLVGAVYNSDSDPAHVTLAAGLKSGDISMAQQTVAEVFTQRLLPAESAGYRIDFEGVLSLEDALNSNAFDPTLFIPPELPLAPDGANLQARALVTGRDLYRGVGLNAVQADLTPTGVSLSGLAVNTGLETATIVKIVVLLFDLDGQPIWADVGYVEQNIYPGQSNPFSIALPFPDQITVIGEAESETAVVNGSNQSGKNALKAPHGFVFDLPENSGYSTVKFNISSMTYDPVF